ncbi:MAG: glutathione S-transferase [Gammaproteobacteria bacterium]
MQVPGLPILYSFRRCPYAMRARMSLVSADIRCELREVVLREKPAAMIAISPKATVPVLQLADGTVIDESLEIMRWALEQRDPEGWLHPASASPDEAFALIEKTEGQFKPHLDRYKYPDRYPGESAQEHRAAGSDFVALLEERLAVMPYLFGSQACIADIAIFPFVRQFANTDQDWFQALPYVHVQAWLATLLNGADFSVVMKKYPQWQSGNEVVLFP